MTNLDQESMDTNVNTSGGKFSQRFHYLYDQVQESYGYNSISYI